MQEARNLERYLSNHMRGSRGGSRGGVPTHDAHALAAAASALLDILEDMLGSLGKPRGDGSEPPNPAEVPQYVGTAEAKAAAQHGVQRVTALLQAVAARQAGSGVGTEAAGLLPLSGI